MTNNTIIESREVTFFEDIFLYKTRISNQVVNRSSNTSASASVISLWHDSEHLDLELRRSKRTRIEKTLEMIFIHF